MGDFVKGVLDDNTDLSSELRQGIVLHRRIDRYCDSHPIFIRSKRRIQAPYQRYVGILIDMFYDHFLARYWSRYSTQSLRAFCDHVYPILQFYQPNVPPRMQRSITYMLNNDLLMSYQAPEGIARSLAGIEKRLKRPSGLGAADRELSRHYAELAADFELFFPDMMAYSQIQKIELNPIHV